MKLMTLAQLPPEKKRETVASLVSASMVGHPVALEGQASRAPAIRWAARISLTAGETFLERAGGLRFFALGCVRPAKTSGEARAPIGTSVTRVTGPLLRTALALACSGCFAGYNAPRVDEPHAIVKIRRTYEKRHGTHLRESAFIDGREALYTYGWAPEEPVQSDTILVRPLPTTLELEVVMWSLRKKPAKADEEIWLAGMCNAEMPFAPAANGVYQVEFVFHDAGACDLAVFEEVGGALRRCAPEVTVVGQSK